jgi:hypothetical protein
MATLKQVEANRLNATHSTGPRTESGREAAAQNHLTLGLFTRRDYVKPEERDLYKQFCDSFYAELGPEGHIESALADDIIAASWRLRRCSEVDGDLADYAPQDPLLDESTEKTRRAVERARNSAHGHFHRSINQLRKIQTEREVRIMRYGENCPSLAESNKVAAASQPHQPNQQPQTPAMPDIPDSVLFHDINRLNRQMMADRGEGSSATARTAKLGSNCQEPADTEDEAAEAAAIAELTRKFLSLDEAGQLQLLADQRKIDEAELEAILNAA